jgi:peptidoglycan hydrolase-like protein with peptidoglycan-binding domain
MSRNVTEIQKRLIDLGFLAAKNAAGETNADGRFGALSLGAYNRFLASKGRPPVEGVSMAQLNADLFPDDVPAPKPKPIRKPGLRDVLALALTLFTSKGKPMQWSTVEQLIRIAAYVGGSALLGQQVADGQMFQAALAGLLPVAAFLWWLIFERNRPKA